jgi:nucleoside-diphosphate-sugar epimerase
MKVFMIAGGHEVTALALPPVPTGAELPPEMQISFGSYMDLSDDEIRKCFEGCEGFVFAAGVDERVEGPAPIYDMFKKYNITPLERLLRIAKECGVKHAVICGSYFSYFAKIWPEKELTRWHPYIRSRVDQETMALSFADENFDVAVLELPYIFGTQPGRKPVWVFLVEQIRGMKKATMYPKGGTTMVTVRQVGEALVGALLKNKGGNCYPIGYYNLTWVEMLRIVHKYMGCPDKKITTIPNWMYAIGCKSIMKQQQKAGHEGGLHMVKFTDVMCAKTFIDKSLGCEKLGVAPDDIDAAIGDSIKLCLDILDGKSQTIDMKGE